MRRRRRERTTFAAPGAPRTSAASGIQRCFMREAAYMDEPFAPTLIESRRDPTDASLNEIIPAGEPWIGVVCRGQTFRIVDVEGNQAVDTLFFNAANSEERYSAAD